MNRGESFLAASDRSPSALIDHADRYLTRPSAIVTTSGSTGEPKGVILSAEAIRASCDAFRSRYGSYTWTNVLPPHYVAGLMVCARGIADEAYGQDGVRWASSDLKDLSMCIGRTEGERNAISLVATQAVRALEDEKISSTLARYDLILLGGSAISARLVERCREAGWKIIISYGMSETCGGCVYDGYALEGVNIDIDDDGRIHLSGPMVCDGYLRSGDENTPIENGSIATSDRGHIIEGRLEVLGRMDDIVITGGINVDLSYIQRVVDEVVEQLRSDESMISAEAWESSECDHRHARHGVVIAVTDQEWGEKIVLFVDGYRSCGDRNIRQIWKEYLESRLQPYEIPKEVIAIKRWPMTSTGKIDRQRLVTLCEPDGSQQ